MMAQSSSGVGLPGAGRSARRSSITLRASVGSARISVRSGAPGGVAAEGVRRHTGDDDDAGGRGLGVGVRVGGDVVVVVVAPVGHEAVDRAAAGRGLVAVVVVAAAGRVLLVGGAGLAVRSGLAGVVGLADHGRGRGGGRPSAAAVVVAFGQVAQWLA